MNNNLERVNESINTQIKKGELSLSAGLPSENFKQQVTNLIGPKSNRITDLQSADPIKQFTLFEQMRLLNKPEFENPTNGLGETMLHRAIRLENKKILNALASLMTKEEFIKNLSILDNNGNSGYHCLVSLQSNDLLLTIFEKIGTEVPSCYLNVKSTNGKTAFYQSVEQGNILAISYFLKQKHLQLNDVGPQNLYQISHSLEIVHHKFRERGCIESAVKFKEDTLLTGFPTPSVSPCLSKTVSQSVEKLLASHNVNGGIIHGNNFADYCTKSGISNETPSLDETLRYISDDLSEFSIPHVKLGLTKLSRNQKISFFKKMLKRFFNEILTSLQFMEDEIDEIYRILGALSFDIHSRQNKLASLIKSNDDNVHRTTKIKALKILLSRLIEISCSTKPSQEKIKTASTDKELDSDVLNLTLCTPCCNKYIKIFILEAFSDRHEDICIRVENFIEPFISSHSLHHTMIRYLGSHISIAFFENSHIFIPLCEKMRSENPITELDIKNFCTTGEAAEFELIGRFLGCLKKHFREYILDPSLLIKPKTHSDYIFYSEVEKAIIYAPNGLLTQSLMAVYEHHLSSVAFDSIIPLRKAVVFSQKTDYEQNSDIEPFESVGYSTAVNFIRTSQATLHLENGSFLGARRVRHGLNMAMNG